MLSLALPYITLVPEQAATFLTPSLWPFLSRVPNSFALLPRADSNQLEHNHNDTRSLFLLE